MQHTAYGKTIALPLTGASRLLLKLALLYLLVLCKPAIAGVNAQTVTLHLNKAPLVKLVEAIQAQTDYRFVYLKDQEQRVKPVTMHVINVSLSEALQQYFSNQPIEFVLEERRIILRSKKDSTVLPVRSVKGRIVSKEGSPLVGITVQVRGKQLATVTNERGEFELLPVQPTDVLTCSGAEIVSKAVTIGDQVYLSITVEQKINELDETLVIGYGTTTKRYNVGSVTRVSSADIEKQAVANPLAALEGRVPGLVVTQTGGLPGASLTIQVRGQSSLNPNPANTVVSPKDNPFFIIDGVPFAPQNNNINQFASIASPRAYSLYGNPYGGMSPFNSINPDDIESIEVLRDADATAIYGSRGANGVILITTKKGKAGTTRLTGEISHSWSRLTRTMDMMRTADYVMMRREAFANDGLTPTEIAGTEGYAPDLTLFDTTKYTDWKDYFLGNTATTTNANVSLSGGSTNTQFFIGAGYRKESYVLPGDFADERSSVNFSMNHNSSDNRLGVELSGNYSINKNNSAGSQKVLTAFTLAPNHPDLLTEKGELIWSYKGVMLDNPLSYLKKKYSLQNDNLVGHLNISYEVAKAFTLRCSFGYSALLSQEKSANPIASQNPNYQSSGSAGFGNNNYASFIVEPQAEYKTKLFRGELTVLVGGSYQTSANKRSIIEASGYTNDALLNAVSAAPYITAQSGNNEYKYIAAFARINYVLQKKYIFSFSGRRDGSSRFGPGRQFGNFGSAGAGWIFSEESFFRNKLPFLSFGKLKASYGITGSDAVGDYQYIQQWLTTSAQYSTYQGGTGYVPTNLYNPDFGWSENRKLQFGLDAGFFNNRILTTLTWYRQRNVDELITYNLPSQTGFNGVTSNFPAVVQNSGWEFDLQATAFRSRAIEWKISFNFSTGKNKLLSFPGIENSSYASLYIVGSSVSVLNKFVYLGIDKQDGVYRFQSPNGATYTPTLYKDFQVIGNLDPSYYGGLGNNIRIGELNFYCFFDFRKQLGINYLAQINNFPPGTSQNNQPIAVLNRWPAGSGDGTIQKFTTRSYGSDAAIAADKFLNSSGAYSDASFLRLRTISMSYNLASALAAKIKMQQLRVYVQAQNLLTITNYKGGDPETQNIYGIPPLRTIEAGFQFTF